MNRVQEYIKLKNILDIGIYGGRNDINPVCGSIRRRMCKLYKEATRKERSRMDYEDNIYFC